MLMKSIRRNCLSLIIALPLALNVTASAAEKSVRIDGSSTVFPAVEAMAEEFREAHGSIKVNIGVSGTGGGFKKFVAKEIDIANASRKMKPTEVEAAQKTAVKYQMVPVAFDGITVVINPKNTWATTITVEELKTIWGKDSKVKNWSDVRKEWPNRPIKLYGPGTDSGTFDFFTEAINGKAGESRSEFVKSEDDNVLVTGVSGDLDAMGYFGYTYFKENSKKLKAVTINDGKNAVAPSEKTIADGSYKPLGRQVFIYLNLESYKKREEVKTFVDFFMKEADRVIPDVGLISLGKKSYDEELKKLQAAK